MSEPQTHEPLERSLTLRSAITLNLLDMIGVGPFLTLPLLIGAMGGAQAMLGWVLGALLALCDGLVWAELGAALPEAGGTYHFLRAMYPGRWGEWLSFVFLFQMLLSAPLSIASGCIGLGQYASVFAPALLHGGGARTLHAGSLSLQLHWGPMVWLSMAAVAAASLLLARKLGGVARIGRALLVVVLGLIAWTVVTGVWLGHWRTALSTPPGAWQLNHGFWLGLGSAMLIATYDYWGYYNVVFLGGEVRDPGRTIPRAVLLSIAIVAGLYLLLNASVLSVLPAPVLLGEHGDEARRAMLSLFMQTAYAPVLGEGAALWLAKVAAALVALTAFGSVFSLLLGYSRIPYAAAREGGFFSIFARVHPTRRFPWVSLLTLAATACAGCLLSLPEAIAALVVVRITLQFGLQHVGVMVLRRLQPGLRRPFRLWLYPLPPLLALAGFGYVLLVRTRAAGGLLLVAGLVLVATVLWWLRRVINRAPSMRSVGT